MSKAKLKDLCLKIGSGATPKGGNNVYLDKGNYSLIRSQNIYNEGFSEQGIVYISDADAKKLENVDVKEDDVLINITGDSVARVSLPNKKYLPARVNQHVSILRANPEKLDFKFLKYVLVEKSMQEYLLTLASSGATRNALTKAMLENIEIDLPSLNDQKRISNFLSKFDEKSKSIPKSIKPWNKSPKPCLKAGLSISIPYVPKSKPFQTALALNKQNWQPCRQSAEKHPKN